MDYSAFAQRAVALDKRNRFSSYEGSLDAVPEHMKDFYRLYNPVDVELSYEGTSIKFYPVEQLDLLQEEYAPLKGQFVFATCNSDPIWCYEGKIYTGPHGTIDLKWELLAEKIGDFLTSLVE